MTGEADARRIAAGPSPSQVVRGRSGASGAEPSRPEPVAPSDAGPAAEGSPAEKPFDPLRLCIFATIALLGWLLGPLALLFFAGLGFAGYWRARRAGLTRSKCLLRDTRLVLAYLAALAVAALLGIWYLLAGWFG
ncbi:hypothetical protein [Micropruina sp.]|uniref:hypothetical protein n=1 Tax=Micropruina sp. TaxID=2737536 RepID=UPI0026036B69|nr:hypothetical protein [Micropruina sp.]